ncbi:MAG: hypothetical protein KY437_00505 [Actinobacteria bacterium]|nr:hypothetical protein [Actinomycetota bacterium]
MTREHWVWLPIRLAIGCVAVGVAVILGLYWGSGEQISASTQLPFVLVAGGAGLGLVLFGVALFNTQRQRIDRQRLEDGAARMLVAAARLSQPTTRVGSAGTLLSPAARRRSDRTLPDGRGPESGNVTRSQ